ncbi:MAG: hypothetical protein Q9207_005118 [Kuettlingeria erythrocarpa]
MDPVSLLSIITASTSIALHCGKAVRGLNALLEKYRYAELSIKSMSIDLDTIQCAWRRIRNILEDWAVDEDNLRADADKELLMQLARSLDGGMLVISALATDLRSFLVDSSQPTRLGFRKKTQFVWDVHTLRDHQDRIRDQVQSMNLLLSVIQLDGSALRRQRLVDERQTLQRSDESAYALVLSNASSHQDNRSLLSLGDEEPLVYRELSIDPELFSAQVYKRSSHSPFRRNVLPSIKPTLQGSAKPNPSLAVEERVSLNQEEKHPTSLTKQRNSGGALSTDSSTSSSTQVDPIQHLSGWVTTEWMVGENLRGNRCIPGPTLSPEFIHEQPMGHMKTTSLCRFKLHFAVANKKFDFKRLFGDCNNIAFEWLQHCVMTACLLGDQELLKLVIDRDIHLCSLRCEGYSYAFEYPIELAYRNDRFPIVKLLLERGSQVLNHCRDLAGELVHTAIWTSDKVLLSVLLKQDSVDIRFRYAGGGQAIHVACLRGSLECLGLLIEAGADLDATDHLGFSAFQYLALNVPPETAILGWIPISSMERTAVLQAILKHSPNFVRPTDESAWPEAYIRATQSITGYLATQKGLRHLQDCGPGCCSSEIVIDRLENHLPEAMKRPEVIASLESIRHRTRLRNAANPIGIAV